MVSQSNITDLTEALATVWRGGPLITAEAAQRLSPQSDAEAYAVQAALGATMGWWAKGRPRAWKLGIAPVTAAPIPDHCLMASPVRLNETDCFSLFGIEVELAVRLKRPLYPGCRQGEAALAIGETMAVIELFDVRAANWQQLPRTFLLADLQMHGRLIIGDGVAGPWQSHFADSALSVSVNDQPMTGLALRHPMGDPLALLPWLAMHTDAAGWGLAEGDVISTGSWTGMFEAKQGQRIEASFANIGSVSLEIDAAMTDRVPT
ncbi:MAG: fumarylacetoacetate hydrolase family protein [Halomonas sp.]|nr:fumarylacetoacetate hydrolase family protein [Halomonas sp.]MBR2514591.1 fumarylacetoacetate hydrolase family protein [Halomonas sp.]